MSVFDGFEIKYKIPTLVTQNNHTVAGGSSNHYS
jgi:hypothetical protein